MSERPTYGAAPNYYGVLRDGPLREAVGGVVNRWYRAGLLRFNTRDDGSDDLLLRDEICSAVMDALRSPRNAAGNLALPEGLMERAVEAAWEGATSSVGDPADGIEMHSLSELADGICNYIAYGDKP